MDEKIAKFCWSFYSHNFRKFEEYLIYLMFIKKEIKNGSKIFFIFNKAPVMLCLLWILGDFSPTLICIIIFKYLT